MNNLGLNGVPAKHDPDKVIFNYSSHSLTEAEKSLLSKGLNFSIPPKTLNYADSLTPFELLHRDVKDLDMENETRETVNARVGDIAYTTYNG